MAYPRLITKVGDAWLHGVLYARVSGRLNVGAARVPDCAADDASGDGADARRGDPCHVAAEDKSSEGECASTYDGYVRDFLVALSHRALFELLISRCIESSPARVF